MHIEQELRIVHRVLLAAVNTLWTLSQYWLQCFCLFQQGLGGMGMGNPEQMQQAMSQMMNNPMMQSVLNDPEMLRNMFSSNPAIQQVHALRHGKTSKGCLCQDMPSTML